MTRPQERRQLIDRLARVLLKSMREGNTEHGIDQVVEVLRLNKFSKSTCQDYLENVILQAEATRDFERRQTNNIQQSGV